CCQTGAISYSTSATGNDFSYTPNGDYDPNVRRVRIQPTGAVPDGYDTARTFELLLRMRVKE
ncbi:MAG: hypothetical protein AAFY47_13665, partial [Pseudomonadota bacterium]